MDGVHDMGGMHGFGAVVEPGGECAYHEHWEPRVFAIQMLVGAERLGAGPGGRPVREEMPPADYLAASYYERWLYSAEQRLLRKGTIRPGEVEAMMARLEAGEAIPEHRDRAMADRMLGHLRSVQPMDPVSGDTRFSPGESVRVRRMHPPGHTRCPRYARGAVGRVEAVRGADRLPDRAVYGEKLAPEPVYSVAFASEELWGPSEEPPWRVLLDLWESYLEPA
ncbi:MAG TPA: nitrile hydratase subunit beta [Solirubrobacteraceae bacterium]|nr:nitrile hydratase subunit beta [Solirubrobacteraceae bacterium]